jgi:hypothetical protein
MMELVWLFVIACAVMAAISIPVVAFLCLDWEGIKILHRLNGYQKHINKVAPLVEVNGMISIWNGSKKQQK